MFVPSAAGCCPCSSDAAFLLLRAEGGIGCVHFQELMLQLHRESPLDGEVPGGLQEDHSLAGVPAAFPAAPPCLCGGAASVPSALNTMLCLHSLSECEL